MEQLFCPWENPSLLLFSSNVPFLLPYSHFIALAASILSALFLLKSGQQNFGKIFLFMSSLFSVWVLIDWHIWATNKSNVVMFLWSTQILIEISIYLSALYLTYTFVRKVEPRPIYQVIGLTCLLPILLFLPTNFVLNGIDISYCDAVEHPFIVLYSYIFEAIVMIFIIDVIAKGIAGLTGTEKMKRALFGFGIITFLLAFTSGNIIGSLTENWSLAQFGLFGMPLFMGVLSYSILRYKAFDTKVFSAEILVSILALLTSGILFLRTIERVRWVTSITLVLIIALGLYLIRSVKREIEQRERIEKLAKDLEGANKKLQELDQMKSEFLSLATHQIRAPLTAIKGYSSMLIEGDFGTLPIKAKESVNIIMASCQNLINIVQDFLDISRLEQGRMAYDKSIFEVTDLILEVTNSVKPNIMNAGLTIDLDIGRNKSARINADKNKVKQIIGNILDNAVKYTIKGGIKITVESNEKTVKIIIKDTGVGMDQDEIGLLFDKFSRSKDANKTNVLGTGLGLYIAKKMAEDQGGHIIAESGGKGKGSTFTIELPRL